MTLNEIKQSMSEHGLARYFERMHQYARNAICINPVKTPEAEIPVGSSKFGGHPDLPEGFQWPYRDEGYPLLFLCQFNLSEVAPYDLEGKLPHEGMLYFFYDVGPAPRQYFLDDRDGWAVRYHPDCNVTRQNGPQELPGYFRAGRLEYATRTELPFHFSDLIKLADLQGHEYFDLWEWDDEVMNANPDGTDISTKLLGHSSPVQTCGMELDCEENHRILYGTEGCRYEDPKDPRNALRWVQLLQLDSHRDIGWIWDNGYGRVYLWIEAEDLKQRRFDRVLVDFQAT